MVTIGVVDCILCLVGESYIVSIGVVECNVMGG